MTKAEWTEAKLREHDQVGTIIILNDSTIEVTKRNQDVFRIGIVSLTCIDSDTFDQFSEMEIDFLMNIRKDVKVTGLALGRGQRNDILLGGLGDLFRALSLEDFYSYINPNVRYVHRGLEQHTNVAHVVRLDDKRYQIYRENDLPPVIVYNTNEYEVTNEVLRDAIEQYVEFDAVVCSNPNHRITLSAENVATNAGIKIFSWGELLGALNRRNL